ncbi:MAG: Fur family transcriptional regulator [Nitrospinaceae bacterium]
MDSREQQVLENYITQHNLKITRQRRIVLDVFLGSEDHVSAEDLYKMVTAKEPKIGLATVYRTLSLLTQSGLATELDFGDGQKRYEHKYMHSHHDHMICTECGKIIEFHDPTIEKLQEEAASQHGFKMTSHKLDVFGLCEECQ